MSSMTLSAKKSANENRKYRTENAALPHQQGNNSGIDIDGGLIGGAALDAVSFMGIVNAA